MRWWHSRSIHQVARPCDIVLVLLLRTAPWIERSRAQSLREHFEPSTRGMVAVPRVFDHPTAVLVPGGGDTAAQAIG